MIRSFTEFLNEEEEPDSLLNQIRKHKKGVFYVTTPEGFRIPIDVEWKIPSYEKTGKKYVFSIQGVDITHTIFDFIESTAINIDKKVHELDTKTIKDDIDEDILKGIQVWKESPENRIAVKSHRLGI